MIDLTKFMLISIEQFDSFVESLEISLSHTTNTYMLTYLVANLVAYLIIFFFIISVLWLYRQLFSKKRRSWI